MSDYPISQDYEDGNQVIAGKVTIDEAAPLGPDTFYQGMLLEYDSVNHYYIALATDANMAAIYNGPERTLASAGVGSIITSGEVFEGGLVSAADAALTLSEDQIATYRDSGFYIKRK